MSRVHDLTAELCPHGVEYKSLGELGEFIRGNGLQKKDLKDKGVRAIHYGQIHTHYGTSATETRSFAAEAVAAKLRKARTGDLVIATTSEDDDAVGKAVAWLGEDEVAVSSDAYIYRHRLEPTYLSYFFQSDQFQSQKRRFISGTKVRRLSADALGKIRIAVPPSAVQQEIAETLTRMEQLEAEVAAELEAELEARRLQFEYYRDLLLSFDREDVPWVPLRELGKFIRGKRFTKRDYDADGVGCIHYGEIYTHYGTSARSVISRVRSDLARTLRFAEPGDVIVVDVGETVEDVGKAVAWLGSKPVAIHDHSYAFRHDLNPTFVSYLMQTAPFRAERAKFIARTKVKTLLIEGFSRIAIPVPPHDEQDRIVAALDQFDALVNDLSVSLAAELKARRKQYEYYRERLLTFAEAA